MKKTLPLLFWCILFGFGIISSKLQAQQNYQTHAQLSSSLKSLSQQYNQLASLSSIAKTEGGKDIWLLTIGEGDKDSKGAIAVVSGVEGSYLTGTELSYQFAEKLLEGATTDSISKLLAHTTFYIFPNMSPDASAQYFAKLRYERSGNAKKTDDDRDGRLDEDGFEDLDNNGMITMMRVEDPTGDWVMHAADARVMTKANTKKGEKGKYKMFTEGRDNDKDGKLNEDGEGGIHFNKSMAYNPPSFQPGAGEYPVSEPENRALLDFLFEHKNIYAVFTFGPGDNLISPLKHNPAKARERILMTMLKKDAATLQMMSSQFNKMVYSKKGATPKIFKGGFLSWSYFHYARMAFGTPGWYPAEFKMPTDSAEKAKYTSNMDNNTDVNFLRWAEKEGMDMSNIFVPWTEIKHPDYPNQKVEVGGFAPFVRNNAMTVSEEWITKNTKFILSIAENQAKVALLNVKQESMGNGVYRVSVEVFNSGNLPAITELGTRSRWFEKPKVSLTTASGQQVLSGKPITLLNSLDGQASKKMTWLIQGKGKVTIQVEAAQLGITNTTIDLN